MIRRFVDLFRMRTALRPFTVVAAGILFATTMVADVSLTAQAQEALGTSTNPIKVPITAGRSTVLATEFDITRIAITNPAVADAVVVAPREILIDGKASGTISLIVWGGGDRRTQYDIVVDQPIGALQVNLRNLFPGENIVVTTTDDATTLSGTVSSNEVMLKVGEIAQKTLTKTNLINLLQVPGGQGSQQVMLQVRFAEVNRAAISDLGVSFFTGPGDGYKNYLARVTPGSGAPQFDGVPSGQLTFSDFLNLFVFNTKYNVGGLLKAMETQGYLQSLAEPNLIAYNGKEASFLAGGEVPVPVVQGNAGGISIQYREFGIRLNFTPTIAGDVIRLKVRPEVSALDFGNGITLSGFRIPALTSRKAETEVELRDGQAFAIAGLMNNISQNDRTAIPLLSSLPIIGPLFKSRTIRQQKTELMVLITPHLVRPLNPDEVPTLPVDASQFLDDGLVPATGAADAPAEPNR